VKKGALDSPIEELLGGLAGADKTDLLPRALGFGCDSLEKAPTH
jgi:hypothetical protein